MGILDEAIREHLDLKRQHGAEEPEVKRLEDEAFGPPARPGEPDFPESQEQPAIADDGTSGVAPEGEKADEPSGEPEAATALLKPEDAPLEATPTTPEPPAMEHPAVEEDAEHATGEAPSEAPPTDEPGGLFDQQAGELNLDDLDLDLADEEVDDLATDAGLVEGEGEEAHEEPEPGAPPEEHSLEDEAPQPEEHPVSNMETVEHPMEEELGVEPPSEEHPATEEEALPESEEDVADHEEGEEGTGEGDVLEETPEFLQDRPEDDELWFEQGQPKDFDF
jgi:hypothetical protein